MPRDGEGDRGASTGRGRAADADRKSTRLNSSHTIISYAVSFFRKSTRLNSSHTIISYAVFCLKKKKQSRSQKTSNSWSKFRRAFRRLAASDCRASAFSSDALRLTAVAQKGNPPSFKKTI